MKAVQQETTKDGLLKRIKAIAKTQKVDDHWEQGIHKLAVVQFILDAAGVKDAELREEVYKQFDATHASFGCNASAFNQACGKPKKATVEKKLDDRFKGM